MKKCPYCSGLLVFLTVSISATGDQASTTSKGVTPRAAPPTSSWVRSVSRSAMDDSKTVSYRIGATGQIIGWLARAQPVLIARCQEGETDVYVRLGMPLMVESGDTRTIRIRIDDEPAKTEFWSQSTDGHAIFSPKPIDLAKTITESKRVRIEVTPFNASPVTMQFNVAGFGKGMKEIEETCQWPKPIQSMDRYDFRPEYSTSLNRGLDVVIHDHSNIYHKDKNCVSLSGKRNVRTVKLGSLSKDFDPCST